MRVIRNFVAIALFLSTVSLLAEDPFLGRWALDVQRSKYSSRTRPKQMTIEMSAAGHGIHYHSETQFPGGRTISADYTAEYDGKPAIVLSARGMLLPVSLKRTAPNVVVATYTSGFQAAATSRRAISANSRVMTVTTTSQDVSGKTVTNVGIYRKVHSPDGSFDLSRIRTDLLVPK
ncbi:MAG: hypothetical protein JWM43_2203 [Acidobacteriaceae bacterium]|nr:hypothetical protein [Acidobacteriaceae bacterium]